MSCPLAEMVPLLAVEHEIGVLMDRLGEKEIPLNRNITPFLAAAQRCHAENKAQRELETKEKKEAEALNTSTRTAVEPEDALNTSTLTAVEPEDVLNTSTMIAIAPEEEQDLNTSMMTAMEAEDELNISATTTVEPEDQNNLNISSLTAFELNEEEQKTSTMTAIEPEEVMKAAEDQPNSSTAADEIVDMDRHQRNCARRWMSNLEYIRKNPNADHTANLKVMLDEMKSTWF